MERSDIPGFSDKNQMYRFLRNRATSVMSSENDWLANLSNASALVFLFLKDINWSGFYIRKGNELILGPFQGKPACTRIPLGKGVCGTAAAEKRAIVVPDVHGFPGHIACDTASRSEIVVPVMQGSDVAAVLDIDSPVPERFDGEDETGLQKFVDTISRFINWEEIRKAFE
ncbi:MAG TPA: GAF domain-containing protein [Synergistales bacterium]|nr:GAF domain-containing protein [Synergistales bacterium]